ncbi:hypothetical protein [Rahnella sp. ChDrAdgB13]|uniref:hypothetical protein n=1 Tax=Rahnella sp. ChDrAdgB13 TaxID=1850581 RepID=UPI001AD85A12|nr:hypothetical protein [Rahnella sp. ChDrAdgB13]
MADSDDLAPVATSTASSTASKLTTDSLGFILVVRHAFADYKIGEEITDVSLIKEIIEGEQAVYVIKRAA